MSVVQSKNIFRLSPANKMLVWSIEMLQEDGVYSIVTSRGQVGGKIIVDSPTVIRDGKAGRSVIDQAKLQYNSLVKKKTDMGYTESEDGKNENLPVSPMLAQNFEVHESKILFPASAQPKLDGVRCIVKVSNGNIEIVSRTGKDFTALRHIKHAVNNIDLGDIILDGELFSDVLDFQRVVGLVRKKNLNNTDRSDMNFVKFNVFDCINPNCTNMSFIDRWELVDNLVKRDLTKTLVIVPVYQVENRQDIEKLLFQFLENGDEGIMIRNTDSPYEIDKRSYNLQKYKRFMDSEYQIVGSEEGNGNDKGTVIWVCVNEEGKEFNVRPKGTRDDRRFYYDNRTSYYGKLLTVKYQELTNDGIPRFPVGITMRDYE